MPPTLAEQIAAEEARRAAAKMPPPEAAPPGQPPMPGAPQPPDMQAQIAAEEARRMPGVAEDVLYGAGAGLRRGIEGIPGAPGDIAGLGRAGLAKVAGWMGADPETVQSITDYDIPGVPNITSESIHEATTPFIGESYEPQTTAGKFARTAGEFAPGFVTGPSGMLKNVARGVGAGLASEAAGQATAGTELEPYARAGAGIAGGALPEAAGARVSAVRNAPQQATEIAAEDAARQHGVKLTAGERSGDVTQQMDEQQMLHGAKGSWAQKLMETRRQENLSAIKDASTGIMDKTAPTRGSTPVDSAANLNRQTGGRARSLMDQGGKAIEDAINSNVMIDADRLRGLPTELRSNLEGTTPHVPDVIIDVNTPIAKQAMERVDSFIRSAEDPDIKEVALGGAERLRQQLSKLQANTPEDRRAMGKVMEHFDNWYDDAISNDARVMPDPNAAPGSAPDPRDVLSNLVGGRQTFKQGADIARPRGKPVGGKEVAKIADEGTHPEDTARLFKPNDRGELSGSALDAIERLKGTGAESGDLDQVRSIVLDQILTGDPGKVATRIDNFTRNNPTAANHLFTADEIEAIKAYGGTNKRLVPDPKATNPSKTSYGVIRELARSAGKSMTGQGGIAGALMGGPVGAGIGAAAGAATSAIGTGLSGLKAKKALKEVDRSTPNQYALTGARKGATRATPGALRGGQSMTIDDPGGDRDGERGTIIDVGDNMITLRMSDGKTKQIGKRLVKPDG